MSGSVARVKRGAILRNSATPFSSACLASADAWSAMSSSAKAIRAFLTAADAERAVNGLNRFPPVVGSAASGPAIASRTSAQSSAARELDHRELRREHRARSPQTRHDRRVLADDLIAVRRRAPGGRRAAGGEQILRAVGNPRQRLRLLATERRVGALRFVERAFGHERGERVVTRRERFEKLEGASGELDRREATLAEGRPETGGRREADL